MLALLHYRDVVQPQVLQSGDRLGEVRARDLHFFYFIKVRLYLTGWLVEHVSDADFFTFRSNDYSRNIGVNSKWKALLLNKVVVGNGKKLTQDNTSLTKPPPGYDSVSIFEPVLLWVH